MNAGAAGLVRYDDIDKPPPPAPGPGIGTPGVKIPMARLVPEAVFATGGCPDWLAPVEGQGSVWVSDNPNGRVVRLDATTNTIAAALAEITTPWPTATLVDTSGSPDATLSFALATLAAVPER